MALEACWGPALVVGRTVVVPDDRLAARLGNPVVVREVADMAKADPWVAVGEVRVAAVGDTPQAGVQVVQVAPEAVDWGRVGRSRIGPELAVREGRAVQGSVAPDPAVLGHVDRALAVVANPGEVALPHSDNSWR